MSVKQILGALLASVLSSTTEARPTELQARFNHDDFPNQMVLAHNYFRYQHGADNVTWSDAAAQAAAQNANGCVFQHSGAPGYGENIVEGGGEAAASGDYVNIWGLEREKYDFNNPGFTEDTGHFTQVVWKSTTEIGCAFAACSGSTYVVCEYSPPGNYVNDGEFEANVLRQVYGVPSDSYQGGD